MVALFVVVMVFTVIVAAITVRVGFLLSILFLGLAMAGMVDYALFWSTALVTVLALVVVLIAEAFA